MSDRDHLLALLEDTCFQAPSYNEAAADAILAAGYRRPPVIHDRDERAREELAIALHAAYWSGLGQEWKNEDAVRKGAWRETADAFLCDFPRLAGIFGFIGPQTITDRDELAALPDRTVVRDARGDVAELTCAPLGRDRLVMGTRWGSRPLDYLALPVAVLYTLQETA